MKARSTQFLTTLAVTGLTLLPALADAQCALCKRALESGGGDGLIRGFFWSIVLLISLPITMASAFAWALYRGAKRRSELLAEQGVTPLEQAPAGN